MNSINLKNLLKYFNEESVIPLKLYFASTPFIVLITVLLEVELDSPKNIFNWILVALYSILVTSLYVFFFKYVLFAAAKHIPINLFQVFFYTLGLGLIKGVSTYYFSVWLKVHNHPIDFGFINIHLLKRVVPAMIVAFCYVPIMSWLDFTLTKYRKIRNELTTQAARLELENQGYKKLIEESKQTLRKKMRSIFQDIKTELDKIQNTDTFEDQWNKIADLVRNAALYDIRPQSHTLWNENIKQHENLKFYDFLKTSLRLNPYPWHVVVPVFLITSYAFLIFEIRTNAFENSILAALAIFISFQIGIILNKLKSDKRNFNYFITMTFITVLFIVIANLFMPALFPVERFSLTFAGITWLVLVSIISSLVISFNQTKDKILKDIQNSLNEKRIHKEMLKQIERRINTKLAKFLHGNVQARLMSNALQLELASKNNDKDLASKELAKLSQDLIDDYGIMNQFESTLSFSDAMQKIKDSWAGICEIEILGDKLINLDQMIIRDFIEDAIAEAIANAVRHGMADKIKILFRKISNSKLEISITDNGVGPIKSEPGMGSEIFNLLSGSNWQLIPNYNGKGSLLILNIDTSIENQPQKG